MSTCAESGYNDIFDVIIKIDGDELELERENEFIGEFRGIWQQNKEHDVRKA